MNRKKKLQSFESVQREIARRLQAKLPLAGMIAATALLCGCGEQSNRVPMGSVENDNPPCDVKTGRESKTASDGEKPAPRQNQKNETFDPAQTRGKYPVKKTDK